MNKSKNSPMLTVDAHLKNKKEDVLLLGRLDHLHHGHRIVLSSLQQESTTVTEELQNLLRQKSILQNFKLDDLILQLKGNKDETNSDWNSKGVRMNPLFSGKGKIATSSTQNNPQSGEQRSSLLGTWAGLNGRISPNSFVHDEFDGRSLSKQYVKRRSLMSSSASASRFRRSMSTTSLRRGSTEDGDIQSLTHKELRRMASIDNIYQKELEKQKHDRLQEREQFKKFMDEKIKEKINNFIKTLDIS